MHAAAARRGARRVRPHVRVLAARRGGAAQLPRDPPLPPEEEPGLRAGADVTAAAPRHGAPLQDVVVLGQVPRAVAVPDPRRGGLPGQPARQEGRLPAARDGLLGPA